MVNLKNLFGIFLIGIFAIFVSSCSNNEEDEITTINYTMGFESVETSDLSEMTLIENAYLEALGVTSTNFQMEGEIFECDQKVIDACHIAEKAINNMTLKGSYTFVVTNLNTGDTFYSNTIQ